MDTKNGNEELNLLTLFKSLSTFISKNKIKISIAFVIYFILGSFYYFFLKPNEYQSKLTISSKVIKAEDANTIIKTINNYIKGRELDILSNILNISPEEAKSLTSINADYLEIIDKREKTKEKDELEEEKFVITAKASNNMVFKKLNTPILNILKNSEYYKIKSRLNKSKLTNLYTKLNNLINQLDTINPKLFENYKSNNKFNSIFLSNPGDLSETIIKLSIEKEKVQEDLVYETELIVIEKFQNFSSIENKYFNKFLLSMAIISILLSLATITFLPNNK